MAISLLSVDTSTYVMDVDGVTKTVPRSMVNSDVQRFFRLGTYCVAKERFVYNAFPSWVKRNGNVMAFVYSSGAGHANSDRQRWVKVYLNLTDADDDPIVSVETGSFYENAASEGVSQGFQDLSWLDDILAVGEVWAVKNVFKVRRTSDGYETSIQSTVAVTGQGSNNGTYALWTAKPVATGGKLYCTGYRTTPTPWQTALFESSDGGWTWSFTAIIASDPGLQFNEAAIVKCANGDFLAVIREESGAGRPLYLSRCTSGVTSWSTPTLLSGMQGVQPSLTLLSGGDVVLTVGHRTGISGLDATGKLQEAYDMTGIAAWRSANHGVTWPNKLNLAPMWSTDGPQPMPEVVSGDYALIPCYLAPGATNGDVGVEPGIYIVGCDIGRISG